MTIYELMDVSTLIYDANSYAPITPSLIENTTMQARSIDNGTTIKTIRIAPVTGYVMHDKNYDVPVLDPDTWQETGEIKRGYRTSEASVFASYDFTTNPREFYAIPADSVPAN